MRAGSRECGAGAAAATGEAARRGRSLSSPAGWPPSSCTSPRRWGSPQGPAPTGACPTHGCGRRGRWGRARECVGRRRSTTRGARGRQSRARARVGSAAGERAGNFDHHRPTHRTPRAALATLCNHGGVRRRGGQTGALRSRGGPHDGAPRAISAPCTPRSHGPYARAREWAALRGAFPGAHTVGRAARARHHESRHVDSNQIITAAHQRGARRQADARPGARARCCGGSRALSCCPGYRQRSSSRYHPSVVATMRFTRAPCPPPLRRQPRVRTCAHAGRRVRRQAGRRRAACGVSDACRGRGPCTVGCARAPPGREQGALRGGPPACSKMCEHMGGHAVHLDTFFFFLVTFFFSAGVCALSVATYAGWNRA